MKRLNILLIYAVTLLLSSCSFAIGDHHFLYECQVASNELSTEQLQLLSSELNSQGALNGDVSIQDISSSGLDTESATTAADTNAEVQYKIWSAKIDVALLRSLQDGVTFEYKLIRHIPSSDPDIPTGTVTVATTHFEKEAEQEEEE